MNYKNITRIKISNNESPFSKQIIYKLQKRSWLFDIYFFWDTFNERSRSIVADIDSKDLKSYKEQIERSGYDIEQELTIVQSKNGTVVTRTDGIIGN